MRYVLKNTANKGTLNDVETKEVFTLSGYSYEVTIHPKCDFWRVGFRFTFDRRGANFSLKHRYNDPQIQHLDVCAGIVEKGFWVSQNALHLQHCHFPDLPSNTLHTNFLYEPGTPVKITIRPIEDTFIEITYQPGNGAPYGQRLNYSFKGFFHIFAWADDRDFEVICDVEKVFLPIGFQVSDVKAIKNQKFEIGIHKFAVLYGRNNCGKTSILLAACMAFVNSQDYSMDYLGINRFYSENPYAAEHEDSDDATKIQRENRQRRCENKPGQHESFDIMHEMPLLPGAVRNQVIDFFNTHFEKWTTEIKKLTNYVSRPEPMVNGHNPIEQGTGARAALPIIMQLFNPEVKLLAIDEPELGLEPRMQKIIFNAIKDATEGRNGFPMKRVVLATHSHLFLDRLDIQNNFRVEKENGHILATPLQTSQDLQIATYVLMGSDPSDLFFPSNIIVVEGKSDHIFLEAVYRQMLKAGLVKKVNIVFHHLDGFDNVHTGLHANIEMLKTLAHTPIYRKCICGIFDQPVNNRHKELIEEVRKFFEDDDKKRFVTLAKPAIEYFYPMTAIQKIFDVRLDCGTYELAIEKFLTTARTNRSRGTLFGKEVSKVELAKQVAAFIEREKTLYGIEPIILDSIVHAASIGF
jgi:hypothetical protein